jgi:hypothetical protein
MLQCTNEAKPGTRFIGDAELQRMPLKDLRKIDDVEALQDVVDRLERDIEMIAAQLEFSSADETVDWERRAIDALGIKRAQYRIASRRLAELTKPVRAAPITDIEGVRLKAEASQRNAESNLEATRLATERARLKYEHLARENTYFRQFASQYLTKEQLMECAARAEAMAAPFAARVLEDGAAA